MVKQLSAHRQTFGLRLAVNCWTIFRHLFVKGAGVNIEWQNNPTSKDDSLCVNFYIENTGSMNGYMCAGSDFKNVAHYYTA